MKSIIVTAFYVFLFFFAGSFNNLCAQTDSDSTNAAESSAVNEEDSTKHRGISFNGYPYAYYTPETQFAFGAGGIMILYTDQNPLTKPSKITLGGYYTTTGQYKITLDPEFYFNANKLYLYTPIYFGHFVDKYWGIGNNTIDTGNEQYTMDVFAASIIFQLPPLWFSANRAGVIFDYDNTTISDKKENDILSDPETVAKDGGQLIGIGGDLLWDSRDNIFFPNSGGYQYFKIVIYPDFSDFVYHYMELDVRNYTAFSKDHVLAGNFFFASASGEIPFYKMPALGGQNRMRGYFEGRYRDRNYYALQLEYRQYFWWKFGFVVFAGMGDVAPEISKFSLNETKFSFGAGLRFLFNKEENVNLRVDLGFGNDGNSGIYFGIEEAF